jgi:hypothetical protein
MEQRRSRRFQLQLPIAVIRMGAARIASAGRTRNLSSTGVLFTADSQPDVGAAIEYIISLERDGSKAVQLRCVGKVLRSARVMPEEETGYEIAATLERYTFERESNHFRAVS